MGVQIQGDTGNVIATKGTYSGNVTIGGTLTYEDVTNIDSVGLVTARQGIEVGASPGVAASISVDGNMIVSGITTIGGDIKVGSGVTIGKDGHLFATGVTTSSTVKVGAAVTISESGIEASGIGITCASINGTQIGGRRNIIINGAMQVAQRGTSSTSSGYYTVDRFQVVSSATDEAPTQAQVNVIDGTPYELGFRKCLKLTNGNQTGGAGATDTIKIQYAIEAQDMATCGWHHDDANDFVTLSFWVRSSVAQNFYGALVSSDGTALMYNFETGSLSANTWTKIIKTIPGNASLAFDTDNGDGLQFRLFQYLGTDYTNNSVSNDAWAGYGNPQTKVQTTTWYTTNDATLELTGVQLEVGPQVTPFEHRSFGEELELCKRYFQVLVDDGNAKSFGNATGYNTTTIHLVTPLRPEMRTTPTLDYTTGTDYYGAYQNNTVDYFNDWTVVSNSHTRAVDISAGGGVSITAGSSVLLRTTQAASKIRFTAEL